jgi:two-component system chemotaxis sensor kinase CheA
VSEQYTNEPMLDMFIFETSQLIEQLEQLILASEKESCYELDTINEIFRIMHTIKGSSAMMMYNNITSLAHGVEDLFYYFREEKPTHFNCSSLSDLVLEGVDFIKIEVEKIKNKDQADGNAAALIEKLKDFLNDLKQINKCGIPIIAVKEVSNIKQQYYIPQDRGRVRTYSNIFKAVIFFEEGCEMENIRAYTILHNLKDLTDEVYYLPEDIIDSDDSVDTIRKDGFHLYLKTDYSYERMYEFFLQTIFLKELELFQLDNDDELKQFSKPNQVTTSGNPIKVPSMNTMSKVEKEHSDKEFQVSSVQQSIISVSVTKLDMLMDLVGEMVIAEAMVIQNPDLQGLELDNFQKAARQLNKITSEMQHMVMSIRMVPLTATFQKMNRIVRDMCKKLGKEVQLEISGEETEVDKNIIEHISDPLMHLVRNALDHGVELPEDRQLKGKFKVGTISLEAKNIGSDVLILVKDDGSGLDREKILRKARENNLLYKDVSEMSDKEVFNLILLPGFSTKDMVTEFSGRGVGMDVVTKNIETIGGSISVESVLNKGTTIIMKIPLTLAIIDGMNIKVGESCYTIPTTSIKESFRPMERDIITDPDNNEMIMVRGQCYPLLRLHELYKVKTDITNFMDGIIIMVEQDEKTLGVFADELIGQQQVVVKSLPSYIKSLRKIRGLTGCTLLGDGSISLILDIAGLINL